MSTNPKDKTEKETENKPADNFKPDEKPDPNVKAPAYQRLTEGYDPDNLTESNYKMRKR